MDRVDKKDLKILRELDRDSRQSYTSLGSKLEMPAETVRYRIRKLTQTGVIQNFLTVIDGGKLGYFYYKVFFKLHNVDEQKVQEIIEVLCQDPRICWVVRVDEMYDIAFTPRVSGAVEQSELMDALRQRFSKYLLHWTLSINIGMEFLTRDYLTQSKRKLQKGGSYSAQGASVSLDELGKKVIQELSRDSRAAATEIAARLSISSDAVLLRIRQLERDGVIVRYSYVLNNDALAQVNYYVLVYLNELSVERDTAFREFCRAQPHIVYLIKALGPWDYEINVEARSIDEYRTLMMEMNRAFSDIIKQTTGVLVRRIHKYVYP